MNLEQLRGFAEVARTGHFTRAAEQLHVAQPSLSRQIATLEAELGVELFHRARGNIALTAAGERLLPLARRMLADAETARSEMAELAGLRRGRIRLGATPTLCTSLVVDVLFVETPHRLTVACSLRDGTFEAMWRTTPLWAGSLHDLRMP